MRYPDLFADAAAAVTVAGVGSAAVVTVAGVAAIPSLRYHLALT